MPEVGFALSSEDHPPNELVRQAALGERSGVDAGFTHVYLHQIGDNPALAAGFDVVVGIVTLGLLAASLQHWMGKDAAHVAASLGFGVGFVFIVVGRAELFTENFLVPLAGLDRRSHESWLGLARLCRSFVAGNFFAAAAGNMLGGLLLVTLTRFTQAIHGGKALASA